MKPLKTAEMQLRQQLEAEGWTVLHKGWPDFACVRGNDMMFIEVKNYRGEMLKQEQHYILTQLAKLGLNCAKWTPDGGFERITSSTPMPVIKKNTKERGRRLSLEERLSQLPTEEREQITKDEAEGKRWYL